jgi:hypothetical protein
MCGRPVGFKGKFAKFGGGSTAVMCPASIFAARWPPAQMGSANDIQTLFRHLTAGVQIGFLSFVGSTDHHLLLRS